MINRKELKALSKEQLRGQWTIVVLITLFYGVIEFVFARLTNYYESSFLFSICSFFITLLIGLWGNNLYLKLTRGKIVKFADMFISGTTYLKGLGIYLLQVLMMIPAAIISILVGAFLTVGVVAGIGVTQDFIIPSNLESFVTAFDFGYFLKFFLIFLLIVLVISIPMMLLTYYLYPSLILICEDETRGVGECIGMSFRLMHGNLWKYIVLQLSYLGWALLGVLTLGIGYLWLVPYITTVNMNFFNKLVGYDSAQTNPEQLIY